MTPIELEDLLELDIELEDLLELELEIELDELDEILLELLELELLLLLLLLLLDDEELLLIIISELLETDEEDGTTTCELELLASDDEDTTADEELEGTSSGVLLLDTAAELLIDELLDEDFTELARAEDCTVPVPGTVPPPPPHAVNAADSDTADTTRKEYLRRIPIALPVSCALTSVVPELVIIKIWSVTRTAYYCGAFV